MARAVQLVPAFTLNVNTAIERACIAKFNGVHPALTGATSGGKVFVHQPHDKSDLNPGDLSAEASENLRFLSINKVVTALTAGPLDPKSPKETLLVGTQTNLQAYDFEQNKDKFYKEVADGINVMTFGKVGQMEQNLAIVGGNCSILGFDHEGTEAFWTVTGDNVTALALIDIDNDKYNELIVGSEDFEIRIFQNETVITETTETDKLTGLCPHEGSKFVYSLSNGTVGVYDKASRIWRYKSKHNVSAISAYDMDGDGVLEIVGAWNSGKLEVRSDKNGELMYRDNFPSPVTEVIVADYRMDSRNTLIACSSKGEVRGYLPFDTATRETRAELGVSASDELVQQLLQETQNLQSQIANLDKQIEASRKGIQSTGVPPPATKVQPVLRPNSAKKCVELVLRSTSNTVIRMCIVTAELLFGSNESCCVYSHDPTDTIIVPLSPEKDAATELTIQAFVGYKGSSNFHAFELLFTLSKFAMFIPVKEFQKEPEGCVTFRIPGGERPNRIAMWLNKAFNSTTPIKMEKQTVLDSRWVSLRNGQQLGIHMTSERGGEIKIRCNDMDLAGEIIQDLCADINKISELECEADFPEEFEEFKKVLQKVDEYNSVRLKMTAEMADSSQLVKALVIKAEDARILCDMKLMKRMYASLFDVNKELIGGYIVRANNHHDLLQALKEVNLMIQKAARLRVGAAKARVITECRNSIKANNIHALFRIIRYGGQAQGVPAPGKE